MVKYVNAPQNKKWCLTELGLEMGRIRCKFENEGRLKKQYEKVVPESWVNNGYVIACDKEV